MFVLLSTICGILFRCNHNVVLPVVCSQDHNTELVYNSVVIPFVNQYLLEVTGFYLELTRETSL